MNDFADFANFAIEAANVTKRFGGNVAIKDISLKIAPGEFFSFLGPSGCGKTTLLRMIAGFETPSEGDILINGKSVIAVPPHKRPVNMVFQSYALFPHLTVLENIAFGLKAKAGINKAEVIERSRAALELVRLAHLSER
ncbi:MAG TPA: ABC transporter ATP-binding protein, partial [Chroococcales cyanobacterium]